MAEPETIAQLPPISVTPADGFRAFFDIRDLQSAHEAMSNLDALFATPGHGWDAGDGFPADRDGFDQAARDTLAHFQALEDRQAQSGWRQGQSRHAAHASAEWRAVCTSPDFCRVGKEIVPFDSYAHIHRHTLASPNTFARGTPLYRLGDLHQGVLGDAGQHVVAGTSLGNGYVKFLTGQNNVVINGRPAIRHDSLCLVNCNAAGQGGAPGQVVTDVIGASSTSANEPDTAPNAALQALLDDEADERSWWEKTKDAGAGVIDGARRLGTAALENPGEAGIGVLKGIGNLPSDLWNMVVFVGHEASLPGQINKVVAGRREASALEAYRAGDVDTANALATSAAEQRDWGTVGDLFTLQSDAEQAGAIASMAVPLGGMVKAAGGAAKVGRGAQALDASADAARTAESGTAAARTGELASDTSQLAGRGSGTVGRSGPARQADDTADVIRGEPGVHIVGGKPRLQPNVTYELNGYRYTTDAQGRIKSVEGTLRKEPGVRNDSAQRKVGKDDGRLPEDHGGHLIGAQFGGHGGMGNLTPMHKGINSYPGGEWGRMEKRWADQIKAGNDVQVRIEPIYTDDTLRATGFKVRETINGSPRDIEIINL